MKPYTIQSLIKDENEISATIVWNPNHEIFLAHFPEKPVVPGALMISIMSEIVQNEFENTFNLKSSKRIKFLNIIEPNINKTIQINIKTTIIGDTIKVVTVLRDISIIFFKFSGTFAKF